MVGPHPHRLSSPKMGDSPLFKSGCLETSSNNIIGGEKNKEMASSSKDAIDTATTATTNIHNPRRRMLENFLLMWMDENIDETQQDCQKTLTELCGVINAVYQFNSRDECVDFLSEIVNEKAFMIVTGTIGEQIVPFIHEMPQLDAIYIFCDNKLRHDEWTKEWMKVKCMYTESKSICEALQVAAKQCNQDSILLSFISMGEGVSDQKNLDKLDLSFMYTQIFKELLLEMKYERQSIDKFSTYCRNANYGSKREINRFEDEYQSDVAVWWYTHSPFIYSMLNRALEADTISDLQSQITQIHRVQLDNYHEQLCTANREQGLFTTDFDKLQKTKGGLMFFNSSMVNSVEPEDSLVFAESSSTNTEMLDILFQITIDPSISSTPLAAIDGVSYFNTENEVLFSKHTVIRIGEIKQIDNNDRLYPVELELTGYDDEHLRLLTKRIREAMDGSGWQRLGDLLVRIDQCNKAGELYTVLLEQTSGESERALYFNQLGYVEDSQDDYEEANLYYEKTMKSREITLPSNHPSMVASYNNNGTVYYNMGEYSKALLFYKKALEIRQKILSLNHPDFSQSYNNIGMVYDSMGEYSKALSFYEQALEVDQETLPPNHISLATSYNNIGAVYHSMGEYSKALLFHEKAFEIQQKTLPPNHPDFAQSHNNIGSVYDNRGEYSKALSFYEQALEIDQKILPSNHPSIVASYNNIGMVCDNMGEYSKALLFHEKALEIRQQILPSNHPDFAQSYNNIGIVHVHMGEYSKALPYYERALDILQSSLPPNRLDLQRTRESIEIVKNNLQIVFF